MEVSILPIHQVMSKDEELTAQVGPAMLHFFKRHPKIGISIDEFLAHPDSSSVKRRINEEQREALSTGSEFGIDSDFSDDKDNERIGTDILTNKNGEVERYWLNIEINHVDYKKAIEETFGQPYGRLFGDRDNKYGLSISNDRTRIYIASKMDRTNSKYRRNGKKILLNYLTVVVSESY